MMLFSIYGPMKTWGQRVPDASSLQTTMTVRFIPAGGTSSLIDPSPKKPASPHLSFIRLRGIYLNVGQGENSYLRASTDWEEARRVEF